ncbi:hypothetical protein EJ06DRAFT_384784 [Trichodelitschia bisporula]|uniref:Uncharacterized protein n=1 Tax=Trichodelitschia bisporula TaxID=703511 RepID=A0A6G1HZ26_9PEZI|nr:hypothetical protein EJ06DRAFT_384784 [Trichodelitschia bisporula]
MHRKSTSAAPGKTIHLLPLILLHHRTSTYPISRRRLVTQHSSLITIPPYSSSIHRSIFYSRIAIHHITASLNSPPKGRLLAITASPSAWSHEVEKWGNQSRRSLRPLQFVRLHRTAFAHARKMTRLLYISSHCCSAHPEASKEERPALQFVLPYNSFLDLVQRPNPACTRRPGPPEPLSKDQRRRTGPAKKVAVVQSCRVSRQSRSLLRRQHLSLSRLGRCSLAKGKATPPPPVVCCSNLRILHSYLPHRSPSSNPSSLPRRAGIGWYVPSPPLP